MANTFVAIQTVTVTSSTVTQIIFNSIPQTYTDLKLVVSARNDFNGTYNGFTFNFNGGGQGLAYNTIRLLGSGSGTGTNTDYNTSYGNMATGQAAQSTASVYGSYEMYIPNYTSSSNKSWSIDQVTENNGTEAYAQFFAGIITNTAAITSIRLADFTGGGGNIVQHTTATLYGIKNS